MKRIVLWGLSTLSALVALFGYHTSTSSVMATGEPAFSGSLQGQAAADTSGAGSGTPPSDGSSSSSSSGGSSSGGSSSGGSSSGGKAATVTGDVVQTRWGPVQVQVEVSGSTITNVGVLQYPNGNGRDIEISNYALPRLIQETLDAQGSNISMVSGATYTSNGYLQSLQSALDQAGL